MIEGQWVVAEMAKRFRDHYGIYRWHEYERFGHDWDIEIRIHDRGGVPPAFHVERIVLLRDLRIRPILARRAWHEIGHIIAFPFNSLYWSNVPWGYLVERKTEKRTSDFARLFPIWDNHDSLF